MDLLNAMNVSGTALAAHRTKMNIIAENLANVDTTRTIEGGPYKRKMVVFEGQALDKFKSVLQEKRDANEVARVEFAPITFNSDKNKYQGTGTNVAEIVESQEDFRLVYNPAHPDADPVTGYVAMPNVDHLTEVADMIVAKRSYEASVTAMSNTKSMILKALEIGK
ncbi:MAG: flagellar basal body rod protein FlgC [Thermodesulfobacteriota bacterium]|nr:flagellar basal body rod protein FlgC [Thermodesulfobacteriota bacterium]